MGCSRARGRLGPALHAASALKFLRFAVLLQFSEVVSAIAYCILSIVYCLLSIALAVYKVQVLARFAFRL
jgi:hypothetical protein